MGDALDRVADRFDHHLDLGLHHGAQLAVYHEGDLVLDLAGGRVAPDEGASRTTPDRPHLLLSATTPFVAVCLHLLVEAGALEYDDPVRDHWPEFAWPGEPKAPVTIRHVLSHQAGIPESPIDGDPDAWLDWGRAIGAMEDATPSFTPGSDAAYHPLTAGFVAGELVRRVGGEPVDEFARTRLFEPLDMRNTHIGLPPDHPDDAATLAGFAPGERCRTPDLGLDLTPSRAAALFNREDVRRGVVPSATGIGTARDLARFYACLAAGGRLDGARLLDPETVETAIGVETAVGHDATLDVPRRYTMGFVRAGTRPDQFGAGAHDRVFGHTGLGTVVGWADPESDISMAYVTNGVRETFEHAARVGPVADAVRGALS